MANFPRLLQAALLVSSAHAAGLKVIGAGLRHTGCDELGKALDILGIKNYHSGKDLPNSHPEWTQIMESMSPKSSSKRDKSVLFNFMEEQVNNGYEAVVSSPAAFYTLELLEKWPKAKVILMEADNTKAWFSEMQSGTQKAVHRDMVKAEYHRLKECQLPPADADIDQCTAGYEAHSKQIRKKVPKKQLLEFKLEQGWGPLCEFLKLPVPSVPFPWKKEAPKTSRIIYFAAFAGVLLVVLLVAALVMTPSAPATKGSKGKKSS